MPLLSRLMIRFSLLYFLIGTTIGTLLLISKAYVIQPALWALLPVHIEFLVFGWIIQLTLGVAYWMLPRIIGGRARGNKNRAVLMIILLNAGILLVSLSHMNLLGDIFSLIGRVSETMAVLLFISLHWGRIVSYNRSE